MKKISSPPSHGYHQVPKDRVESGPNPHGRHEQFQFGTNPMEMTPFEKSLVAKEAIDRKKAQRHYVNGIQGRDGGHIPDDQFKEFDTMF